MSALNAALRKRLSVKTRQRLIRIFKPLLSLHSKLFFTYILIGILPLFIFFNGVIGSVESHHIREWTDEVEVLRSILATRIANRNYLFDEGLREEFDEEIRLRSEELGGARIFVYDDGGWIVNDSHFTRIGTITLASMVINAIDNGVSSTGFTNNGADMASASPIFVNDEVVGAVYIVSSFSHIHQMIAGFRSHFLQLAAVISVIVLVLVWFAARLLIYPLRIIVKTVQSITDGNLSERITVGGRDEFGELREAFNKMTAQLEKIDANRQEFVSNVSHELRTPLSSIKVLSDSLLNNESAGIDNYREFMEDISSEVDRMNDIVKELLNLVSLEQGESVLNISQFKLNKTILDIFRRLHPIAETKSIGLVADEVKQVNIDGDEIKLSLAISNLIDNGIKYTPVGGTVKVTVDADHQHAFLTVQDTGIGINEQDQTKIFTRFYRADKTRSRDTGGTGLGLSIAHKTVLLHHGSIKITSKENEGTAFMVRLPLKQD